MTCVVVLLDDLWILGVALVSRPDRHIYNTTPLPKTQETFLKRRQKDCKIRILGSLLGNCIVGLSEAIPIKSHQHGCLYIELYKEDNGHVNILQLLYGFVYWTPGSVLAMKKDLLGLQTHGIYSEPSFSCRDINPHHRKMTDSKTERETGNLSVGKDKQDLGACYIYFIYQRH